MSDTDLDVADMTEKNSGCDREGQQSTDGPRSAHATHSWERGSKFTGEEMIARKGRSPGARTHQERRHR